MAETVNKIVAHYGSLELLTAEEGSLDGNVLTIEHPKWGMMSSQAVGQAVHGKAKCELIFTQAVENVRARKTGNTPTVQGFFPQPNEHDTRSGANVTHATKKQMMNLTSVKDHKGPKMPSGKTVFTHS